MVLLPICCLQTKRSIACKSGVVPGGASALCVQISPPCSAIGCSRCCQVCELQRTCRTRPSALWFVLLTGAPWTHWHCWKRPRAELMLPGFECRAAPALTKIWYQVRILCARLAVLAVISYWRGCRPVRMACLRVFEELGDCITVVIAETAELRDFTKSCITWDSCNIHWQNIITLHKNGFRKVNRLLPFSLYRGTGMLRWLAASIVT